MTSRYRWFAAKWPSTMRTLARRLKDMSFSEPLSVGFVVDRVRDEFIEARYIERLEFDEEVVDPFGKEQTYHRIEYKQTRFRAAVEGPGLELIDPSRSSQAFFGRLAEACEFSLAVAALDIDVVAWSKSLQRNLRSSGTVDFLQIGALELDIGVVGKVVLRGNADVLATGTRLVAGRKHSVERLQIRLGAQHTTPVLLTSSAAVKLDREPSDELLAALRTSLPHSNA